MERKRTPVVLAPRLQAIADLVLGGGRICDVGCDHAHIPLYLLFQERIPGALAMDVIPGPLEKAESNIRRYETDRIRGKIELRLSDGLDAYVPGEAETLVIAGMGGWMIRKILLREPEKTRSFTAMVLQPQSDHGIVRSAIRELGWSIDEERMARQDGKYYQVIRAVPADRPETAAPEVPLWGPEVTAEESLACEDRFGPVLLARLDPDLQDYLRWQEDVTGRIEDALRTGGRDAQSALKLKETEKERHYLRTALRLYEEIEQR